MIDIELAKQYAILIKIRFSYGLHLIHNASLGTPAKKIGQKQQNLIAFNPGAIMQ